ncbi:AMMECR1 domain-containing protein [Dactylosporangium darangshiense]|uniref:AMMECR1 domain-containing protein n=1 Tax=Dactylosporangium darangshiense TaxID=579108 RepID=UPI003631ADDF
MTVTAALSLTDGHFLARLAADAVHARLTGKRLSARIPPDSPLHDDGATFVTLERNGALRGCVGSLEPVRPLHRDVVQNAMRAMNDPRLPPVTPWTGRRWTSRSPCWTAPSRSPPNPATTCSPRCAPEWTA